MSNPYSCPICNAKEALFFKYPLICGKCWIVIGRFDATQLQMKLIFWAAMKNNKSLSQGG